MDIKKVSNFDISKNDKYIWIGDQLYSLKALKPTASGYYQILIEGHKKYIPVVSKNDISKNDISKNDISKNDISKNDISKNDNLDKDPIEELPREFVYQGYKYWQGKSGAWRRRALTAPEDYWEDVERTKAESVRAIFTLGL